MLWWLLGVVCLVLFLTCVIGVLVTAGTSHARRLSEYPDGITRVEALRRLVRH